MNENLPTNVQLDTSQNGTVSFATDVIATIAGLAATEVEGVASMSGGSTGLADILTRRASGSRNLTRGVKVDVQGNEVSVNITIIVEFGSPIPEVAANIQENVKKAIETMSGLTVSNVDVHVQGMSFERENRAAAEIEQQQRILLQKQQDDKAEPAPECAPKAEAAQEDGASEPLDEPLDEAEYEVDLEDVDETEAGDAPEEDQQPVV